MKNENNFDIRKMYNVPAFLRWLFPYKKKGIAVSSRSNLSYYIFQNKLSLILINWFFQGMRSMGVADFMGKILLEIMLFLFFLFFTGWSSLYNVFIALICAHTVNWLLNSHFWDLGRFLGITRTSTDRFFPYIRKVSHRVKSNRSIGTIIVIGGVSRNAGFRETSDVDMIFIKQQGFKNALAAVAVTVRERIFAFFAKFPLHLELYANMKYVKHRSEEVPIILKDIDEICKKWYEKSGGKTALLDDYDKHS